MGSQNEEINVKLRADGAELEGGLGKAQKGVEQATAKMGASLSKLGSTAKSAESQITKSFSGIADSIKGVVVGWASLATIKGLASISDAAALGTARMEGLVGSTRLATDAQGQLFAMSQRLQASYADSVASFSRMYPAIKELGGGVAEATRLSEILITTAKQSGASAAEASGSAIQFAQALGSGVLQGDELRSILEGNQTLARTLAGALGVSIGELRKLGSEGKLTSDLVANALLSNYDKIKSQSAELPVTVGGAWQQIENAFTLAVQGFESKFGVFNYLARIMGEIGKVIELVARRLMATKDAGDKLGQSPGAVSFAQAVGTAFAYIVDVIGAVAMGFRVIGEDIGALAAAAVAVANGDFSGAMEIMRDRAAVGTKAVKEIKDAFTGAGEAVKAYRAVVESQGDYSNEGRGREAGAGKLKSNKKPEGEKDSIASKLEAELEAIKAAVAQENAIRREGRSIQTADEAAFWENALRRTDLTEKDKSAIRKKAADANMRLIREQFDDEIAGLRRMEAEVENNAQAKLAIIEREVETVAGMYGRNSKQFEAAEQRRVQAVQAAQQQIAAIRATAQATEMTRAMTLIDIERDNAKAAVEAGKMTQQQLLVLEEQFAQRKLDIQRNALREALAALDPQKDPLKVAEINSQLELLEIEHQRRLNEIRIEATKLQRNYSDELFNGMKSGFGSVLKQFATGTMTIKSLFREMGKVILDTFVGVFGQIAAKWLATIVMEKVLGKAAALSNVLGHAATAGAAAWASTAAIPVVGPALAPGAAAAAYAGAAAFAGTIPAAKQGWDIPAGLNPVTQLHEREMVLPEAQADAVRDMAEGRSRGAPVELRGVSAGEFFIAARADLIKVLKGANRDFAFS